MSDVTHRELFYDLLQTGYSISGTAEGADSYCKDKTSSDMISWKV